ncbi:enoyl-CoA hydratase [Janibacter alkaliphilus]|uniref:2-(1,2-epoxy-1,2-dihydrophenyl)acetyl-CoA isomerase n=1 Tax=Janibacter alkaliphilus TaxID=1069963 RepID=A0A852X3X9_9MICO|nr:2-(1,2-epoxy-1,2-dihydrophenyl)acetyl-CoA isomerase [Janibacter alkaliphilus]
MSETTSPTEHVLTDRRDGVLTITLNRPERRNAMSREMVEGLAEHLEQAAGDDTVGAVVLTGAGRAFCAGGDVQQFDEDGGEGGGATEVDPDAVALQVAQQRATVSRIHTLPQPVVAALPGAAAGAGLGLALAADLRIGTPRTVVATAFATVGLSGDYGVAWLLDRLVGPAVARELLLLNPRLDGQRCLELGLVNQLVAEDELAGAAHDLAARLAAGPRPALGHIKRNLVDAPGLSLEESMEREVQRHKECGLSEDHVEAVRAFVEKRPPVFR